MVTHTVSARDGHPIAVRGPPLSSIGRRPVLLLLHGRTYSTFPVWETRGCSTLEGFSEAGVDAFALDFRGFGDTPASDPLLRPSTCAADVADVLEWLSSSSTPSDSSAAPPLGLLGWSYGALIAALAAAQDERVPRLCSSLVLYGSVWDEEGDYADDNGRFKAPVPRGRTSLEDAMGDFGVPGSITPRLALEYGRQSLVANPAMVDWHMLTEFAHEPEQISLPTLLLRGDRDPYVSDQTQRALYARLGAAEKQLSIVPGSDHVVHLLKNRHIWIDAVASFVARRRAADGVDADGDGGAARSGATRTPCTEALELAARIERGEEIA